MLRRTRWRRLMTLPPEHVILAIDIDGTISDQGAVPTPRVLQALDKAAGVGVSIYLVTGRRLSDIAFVKNKIDAQMTITSDGATISNANGDVIAQHTIGYEHWYAAVKILEESESVAIVCDEYRTFTSSWSPTIEFAISRGVRKPEIVDLLGSREIRATVVLAVTPSVEFDFSETRNKLEGILDLGVAKAAERFYVIKPLGVDKASAVARAVEAQFGNARTVLVAVGDSETDIKLFEIATHSFAMGNSRPEVKESANDVVPGIDRDGAVVAIMKAMDILAKSQNMGGSK